SEYRVVDVVQLAGRNSQLRLPQDRNDTHVHERGEGYRAHDRDAVFNIADQAQIAAREYDLLDGNGNRIRTGSRIPWILWHCRAVRIHQRNNRLISQESNRGNGTDIEAPQISFTSEIKAFEGWGYQSAITGHERALEIYSNGIAALLHREKLLVLHNWANGLHGSHQPRDLASEV